MVRSPGDLGRKLQAVTTAISARATTRKDRHVPSIALGSLPVSVRMCLDWARKINRVWRAATDSDEHSVFAIAL